MTAYDPLAVAFYDIAHEGAYIRAIAEQFIHADNGQNLAKIHGTVLRSIVIVWDSHLGAKAAALAVALSHESAIPVMITPVVPSYVSALDLVIVLSDIGHGDAGIEQLVRCAQRGVPLVVVAPPETPLASDLAEYAVMIPKLPTHEGISVMRMLATVWAVIQVSTSDPEALAARLYQLADAVDEELAQCHPQQEAWLNPAHILADIDGRILHTFATESGVIDAHSQAAAALTELIAALWATRGKVSVALTADELQWVQLHDRSALADNFDAALEIPRQSLLPLKTIVWCMPTGEAATGYFQPLPVPGITGIFRLVVRAYAATAFFTAE